MYSKKLLKTTVHGHCAHILCARSEPVEGKNTNFRDGASATTRRTRDKQTTHLRPVITANDDASLLELFATLLLQVPAQSLSRLENDTMIKKVRSENKEKQQRPNATKKTTPFSSLSYRNVVLQDAGRRLKIVHFGALNTVLYPGATER